MPFLYIGSLISAFIACNRLCVMNTRLILLFLVFVSYFFSALPPAKAQDALRLPQSSPKAVLTQTIGISDITVTYYRPGVKGRKIYGELVPYGQLWRTGANNATTVHFPDDVLIDGHSLAAGSYSLFSVPGPDSWYVIFNRDTTIWGTEGYQESADLLRLTLKPKPTEFTETMTFSFSDITLNTAKLNLAWENVKITIPIEVEVERSVLREIRNALAAAAPDNWQIYAQAANYYVQQNKNHHLALEWINKSLSIKETYYNNWVKARLLAQKTEYKEALSLAKKTMKLGENEGGSYSLVKGDIQKAIEQWNAKKHL